MNPRDRLDELLGVLRKRLQWEIVTRASAGVALTVLLLLVAAVYWLNLRGYPLTGVVVSRVVIASAVLVLVGVLLWRPLTRLKRDAGAAFLEQRLPEEAGRIQTYLEQQRHAQASPLIDLLAEDALRRAGEMPAERVVPSRRLWVAGGLAAAAVLALVFRLTVGESRHASRYVLLGVDIPRDAMPVRAVALKPGDATIRRNADLNVQAMVQGFKPKTVELFVRFADADRWEQAPMQRVEGEHYAFTLYALRAPLKYYVRADGVHSREHTVQVVDVPRIERLQLTYIHPEWTRLPARVESEVRDISAVADTRVTFTLTASAPLVDPVIVVDQDAAAMLQVRERDASGAIVVQKPARYHIAAQVAGERVALTDDYEITVITDQPPSIEIIKPGRDARASSIEEIPVAVQAQDDFEVHNVELRYAVNGGDWQRVKLPAQQKEVQARTVLELETLGRERPLVPGDLITYYAVTRDRQQSAQTDLFMVQVQPFERRFTEGQGGGGGGGEGDSEQQQIAERQRDLLLATWNLERAREQQRRTPEQLKESAQLLANLQEKLSEQTSTLVERTRARVNVDSDSRLKQFIESLENAVQAMMPAASHLRALELQKAIPNEQVALQMLQRAEASFRDIQVARSQGNPNSGAARASRDISELYELEMDLSKNKYETERQVTPEQREQTVDEAIEKLKELAQRQQQLAEQRREQSVPTPAERWKQEQLQREAEDLRRRLQALADQQMAQQQQSSSAGGQSASSSNASATGHGVEQEVQRAREALRSVEQALQAMRNTHDRRAVEEAARNLQQAAERMRSSTERGSLAATIERLADQAAQVAEAQRSSDIDLRRALAMAADADNPLRMRRDGLNPNQARQLAEAKNRTLREVQQLEDRLRATIQAQRRTAPQTSQRLGEIVDELASINVPARLSQTIVDLERGRADQSSLSEGLVTEALQNTATDLHNAVRLAQRETERQSNAAHPDALLAEVAQLRRALDAAQREAAQRAAGFRGQDRSAQRGDRSGEINPSGQPDEQGGRESGLERGDIRSGGRDGFGPDNFSGPIAGPNAGWSGEHRLDDGERQRIVNAIRAQIEALQQRVGSGALTRADLEALRAVVPQVRRLSGDPLATHADLVRAIERLELAALTATEKTRGPIAARTGAMTPGAAHDAETVAEYYRRLGRQANRPSAGQ